MLGVRNRTKYAADVAVLTDKDGRDVLVVVARATFVIGQDGPKVADKPQPLARGDEPRGEPGKSSLKQASDMVLFKPTTDVIVLGHAHAPPGTPATEMTVEFAIGPIAKKFRVTGERTWKKSVLGLSATDPEPFTKLPLIWERAFGGTCATRDGKGKDREPRNPVGRGFWLDRNHALDQPLPNIEHPDKPLKLWDDRPPPVGCAFVNADWADRVKHAGTCDANWQANRLPLLPEDFGYRFFQTAPTDQQTPQYLVGGEEVRIRGMTSEDEWTFRLPRDEIGLRMLLTREEIQSAKTVLDTVIVEPDERRVQLVWRAKLALPEPMTRLLLVEVASKANPREEETNAAE